MHYIAIAFVLCLLSVGNSAAQTILVNTKAELNSAINSVSNGGTIVIENGTYTNWGEVIIPATKDATQANRKTITAETKGQVTFSGNNALQLSIRAKWWIVSKLRWTGQTDFGRTTSTSAGSVIEFDGAQDSIVDDIAINNVSGHGAGIVVNELRGTRITRRNTIKNSLFSNWAMRNHGYGIRVHAQSMYGFPRDVKILNNLFLNRIGDSSGRSQYWIAAGQGHPSHSFNSGLVIQGNTFKDATISDGGQDVMHMKYQGVMLLDNTFINEASLVVRQGDNWIMSGNKWINPIPSVNSAIRLYGKNHYFINNLCYTKVGSKTCMRAGTGNTDTSGDGEIDYQALNNSLIAHNTFDGFTQESIRGDYPQSGNNDGISTVNPFSNTLRNNVFRQSQGIMVKVASCTQSFGIRGWNSYSGTASPGGCVNTGSNNVAAAPQWVNPGAGDYNLKSTSPLRNAGVDIPGIPETNVDIDGTVRDSQPDIGAYEYSNVVPPPPPDSCAAIFGGVTGYHLCGENSTVCRFDSSTNGATCAELAAGLNRNCIDGFDIATGSGGACGVTSVGCDVAAQSQTCTIEKAKIPPPPEALTEFYVDSSCGPNGNGSSSTCGVTGPWNSLTYALTVADCAGMTPGDTLRIKGMSTTPAAGNWYSDIYYAVDSINPDSLCSNITITNESATHVVLDGTRDLTAETWTSIGSGVYRCTSAGCGTTTTFPFTAWYDLGAGEARLDLIQSTTACTSALATGKMTYNPTLKQVCVHLSDGSNPSAASYIKIPDSSTAFGFGAPEDLDNVTFRAHEDGTGSFVINRFRNSGMLMSPAVNQNIQVIGLDIGWMMNRCLSSDSATFGLGNYRFEENLIHDCGQIGIDWRDDIGNASVASNIIHDIGMAPTFEQCVGVGSGCQSGFAEDPVALRILNCPPDDLVDRSSIRNNEIYNVGGGRAGTSSGIHMQDCTYRNTVDANHIHDSTASPDKFAAIKLTGIPASQYHELAVIKNNRCEDVDYCLLIDFDTATDQTGRDIFFYGNTCHNPNDSCYVQQTGGSLGGQLWFRNNIASVDNGYAKLIDVPAGTMWDANFQNNAFECDHASCSTQVIATFDGADYKGSADCTPLTDCIEDINAFNNIYGVLDVQATTLQIGVDSEAIDQGKNLNLLQTDYLGTPRPFGAASDIGAHEFTGVTESFGITQNAFRFYERFALPGLFPLADENKNPRLHATSEFTLRFAIVGNPSITANQITLSLEVQQCDPSCGSYVQVTTFCAGNIACLVENPNRENGEGITNQLALDGRTYSSESVHIEGTEDSETAVDATIESNTHLELEYSIGMGSLVTLGDVINFRIARIDGLEITYDQTPSITVGPALLDIRINGR